MTASNNFTVTNNDLQRNYKFLHSETNYNLNASGEVENKIQTHIKSSRYQYALKHLCKYWKKLITRLLYTNKKI